MCLLPWSPRQFTAIDVFKETEHLGPTLFEEFKWVLFSLGVLVVYKQVVYNVDLF